MRKILLLGASSWLGYWISQKMAAVDPSVQILGTCSSSQAEMPWLSKSFRVGSQCQYGELLFQQKPDLIINLLRGEGPADLDLHHQVAGHCASTNSFYVYASSALALDGYPLGTTLHEDLPPKSISPYGIFKAKCEETLAASGCSHLILRFASVQGWAPHKVTRNQAFLEKVRTGKQVVVDGGVFQNRLFDQRFAESVVELMKVGAEGVFNLGTSDSSCEVSFLRKEAEMFGWDPDLVVDGKHRGVNLVVKPDKLVTLLGDRFAATEKDTLDSLLGCPGLSPYRQDYSKGGA